MAHKVSLDSILRITSLSCRSESFYLLYCRVNSHKPCPTRSCPAFAHSNPFCTFQSQTNAVIMQLEWPFTPACWIPGPESPVRRIRAQSPRVPRLQHALVQTDLININLIFSSLYLHAVICPSGTVDPKHCGPLPIPTSKSTAGHPPLH